MNILITFNWRNVEWKKILLDYKSKPNITRCCLEHSFYCFKSKTVSRTLEMWQTTSASTSKLYAYNMLMGNSKFNVWDASRLFFPLLFKVVPEANLDLFTSSLWIQNWMKDWSDCLKILRCDKSLCIKIWFELSRIKYI